MWNVDFTINYEDHILQFSNTELVDVKYEPEYGCFEPVDFGDNYFISGEDSKRIDITIQYRGLEGTPSYQVDILVEGYCVKTLMVQTTPNGYLFTDKDEYLSQY